MPRSRRRVTNVKKNLRLERLEQRHLLAAEGLISHWPLDIRDAQLQDDGPANNHLTATEVNDYIDTDRGRAIALEGQGEITPIESNLTGLENGVSVGAWINRSSTDEGGYAFAISPLGVQLRASGDNLLFSVSTTENSQTTENEVAGAFNFQNDTWYHVAGTFNGENLIAYVNGTEVGRTSATGNLKVDGNIFIGSGWTSTDPTIRKFRGKLDEINLFNRALNADQIGDLSRAPSVLETSDEASVYSSGGEPVFVDRAIEIASDRDHFQGGHLTVQFSGETGRDGDRVGIAETEKIRLEGNNVFFQQEGVSARFGEFENTSENGYRIFLNDAATPVAVEALGRALTYSSTLNDPATHDRQLTITLATHEGKAAFADGRVVAVEQAANSLAINTSDGASEFDPSGEAIVVDPGVAIETSHTDLDGGLLKVSFVEASGRESDQLRVENTLLISVVENTISFEGHDPPVVIGVASGGENGTPLLIELNDNADVARVEALARAVRYDNTADETPQHARFARFLLDDRKGQESAGVKKIEIAATQPNAPPVIALADGATEYAEGSEPVQVDALVEIGDADSLNFGGGKLVASFVEQSRREGDFLWLTASESILVVDGNNLFFASEGESVRIGEFGLVEGAFAVHFNENATVAVVEKVARQITFSNELAQISDSARFIQFKVFDGDGADASDVRKIEITVSAVNAAPVIALADGATEYAEGAEPVQVDALVEIGDADSPNFGGGKLVASFVEQSRREGDFLGLTASESILVVEGNNLFLASEGEPVRIGEFGLVEGALVIHFNENATVAVVENVARQITFGNELAQIGDGARFIQFKVFDGDGADASDVRKIEIAVSAVNAAPVIALADGATEYAEGAEPVQVDALVEIGDADSPNFGSGKLVASFVEQSRREGDFLGLTASESILVVEGNNLFLASEGEPVRIGEFGLVEGALVIHFNENATVAVVENVARQITFGNELAQISDGARFIQFKVFDGDGADASDVRKIEIAVSAVNAAPVIALADGATEYAEGSEPVQVDALVEIGDADSPNFGGGKLVASFVEQSRREGDFLGLTASESILVADGNNLLLASEGEPVRIGEFGLVEGALVIHFNENATVAVVEKVARQITFGNELAQIGDGARFIQFKVFDGDGADASDVRRVEIASLNDAPTVKVAEGATVFEIAEAAVIVAPSIEIGDADSGNFAGGSLVVTFVEQTGADGDSIGIRAGEGIRVDGHRVLLSIEGDEVLLGEVRAGDGTGLAIDLTENATPARTQRLARRIMFGSSIESASENDVRFIRFDVSDGDGGSGADVKKIEILFRPDNDLDGVDDNVERDAPFEGDGNQDGIPDSEQDNVASVRGIEDRFVTITSPENTQLLHVQPMDNPSPDDGPAETQFPVGFFDFEVDGVDSSNTTMVTVFLEPGASANTYYVFGPTPDDTNPHWYPFLFDGETGAKIFGDRIELYYSDGGRGDSDLTLNGMIADPGAPGLADHPWQNPANLGDVNNDGDTSARDALMIINDIARNSTRSLPMLPTGTDQIAALFLDVSGDDRVTSLDALRVINILARNAVIQQESESLVPQTMDDDDDQNWYAAIDAVVSDLF